MHISIEHSFPCHIVENPVYTNKNSKYRCHILASNGVDMYWLLVNWYYRCIVSDTTAYLFTCEKLPGLISSVHNVLFL